MISHISLVNYRNITRADTKLDIHNVLIAPNGSGKTNFLESIYYTFTGTSFKSINITSDVIGSMEEFSKVTLNTNNADYEAITAQTENSINRTFKKNNKRIALSTQQAEHVVLVFAPHYVNLVDGPPEVRRNDIDTFLSSLNKTYNKTLKRYEKVRKNKNALLKRLREKGGDNSQLDYWNNELAQLGALLVTERKKFVDDITPFILSSSESMYKTSMPMRIEYQIFKDLPVEKYATELLTLFNENIQKEVIVGKTLYGCHKDTYEILVNSKPVRYFGSRGEQRIATLVLKLAQLEYAQHIEKPSIILIDDIFSELDGKHRKNVAQVLSDSNYQTILTSAEEIDILQLGNRITL